MSTWFLILTVFFIIASVIMVLIILVQRPQGGGLTGAFGGAGASSTETVFGGRVGDALTVMTVIAFVVYLSLAIGLNVLDPKPGAQSTAVQSGVTTQPAQNGTATGDDGQLSITPSIELTPVDPSSDQSQTESAGSTDGGELKITPVQEEPDSSTEGD